MEMQQVRVGRASQVAVPPANAAPLEISQEMRQQLARDAPSRIRAGCAASAEELQMQVEAKEKVIQEQKRMLMQQKKQHETTQRRFEEMLTMFKTAGDAAAVKECEEKLANEKMLLLPCKPRKMEIIRL
ncbi:unnamed protein product [Peronospora destructor]|uniref:Uncharacterized protein n=1 Tax=Peronospora destructor TaxID=86335 RepID=A0AAV0U8M3_9STRA|nr:unnamed protein product [Peronospora destructor]